MKETNIYARVYYQDKVFYVVDSPPAPDHDGIMRCRATYKTDDAPDGTHIYSYPRRLVFVGSYLIEYLDGTIWVEEIR